MQGIEDNFSEAKIQQQVFVYIWNNFPETRGLLFHCPNGGFRNKLEASKLKSQGVIAGISDLIFLWKGVPYGIEIKTDKGVLSKAQQDHHKTWRRNGINTYICYGFEQTLNTLIDIIHGRNLETRFNS